MRSISNNSSFIDTVCKQHSFENHISDIDCHYKEMNMLLNSTTTCSIVFPYPYGKEFSKSNQPSLPSNEMNKMFIIKNYVERLQKTECQQIFDRYTVMAIHEAIASNQIMKPLYKIPPLNSSIQFFQPTFITKKQVIPLTRPYEPRLNTQHTYSISHNSLKTIKETKLPTNFSWMDNIDITRPLDQGTCGSCWAVAASTCLSDVFVASKRVTNPNLSPGYILSCYPQKQCEGGNPFLAIYDMELNGARSSECIPYSLPIQPCRCKHEGPAYFPQDTKAICIPPKLSSYPPDEAEIIQSHLNSLYGTSDTVDLSNENPETVQQIIKQHMYTHGPVLAGFHVFKNFLKGDFSETNHVYIETENYQGVPGIDYSDLDRDWVGSHAIVIVGWGEVPIKGKMVPYWICRNSWGELWGTHKGLFRMAMYGANSNDSMVNRISQFEFPSLVVSETGYGICGGVLLIKAGDIHSVREIEKPLSATKKQTWLVMVLIIIGLMMMIVMFYTKTSIFVISLLVLFYCFLLFTL
jgi:C1A family cysteine protease